MSSTDASLACPVASEVASNDWPQRNGWDVRTAGRGIGEPCKREHNRNTSAGESRVLPREQEENEELRHRMQGAMARQLQGW
jgi:hypothetical protein